MGNVNTRWIKGVVVAGVLLVGGGLVACSSDDPPADGAAGSTEPGSTEPGSTEPGTAEPGSTGEVSVLAYNVAALPVEISPERPDLHLPLISPLLEPFDLVLTQEDFDWWGDLADGFDFVNYHDRLRADVTHEFRSDPHPGPEAVGLDLTDRDYPEVGDGLGMLSRYEMGPTDRVPWGGCFGGFDTSDGGAADCLAMKGFSMTPVTLAPGVVVHVYNLHAEAGGTDADQALQEENFAQLAAYISANSEGFAIILGGDTNLHTNTEHADSGNGADIVIWDTFLAAAGLTDACTATECPHPGRIDKFAFRSGDGVVIEALSHAFLGEEFVSPEGEELSDHQPLQVDFRWTAS